MSLSLNENLEPPKKLPIRIVSHNKKPYELHIFPWMTIAELKKRIEEKFGMPMVNQRLFLRTQELTRNNAMLLSYGIRKNSKISIRTPPNITKFGLIQEYENFPKDKRIEKVVFQSQEGFNVGLVPKPTLEGTSGVYFIRNCNRKNIGIFKPVDEEPFAPNNPKGYRGKLGSQGFRRGVLSGEAGAREVAAYLLDDKGFFDVPPTTFVELAHPYFGNRELTEDDIEDSYKQLAPTLSANMNSMIVKYGSIQKFIDNAEEASDYGHSCFSEEEAHKIAILDILILNCDRNEGNILIKKESNKRFRLIPIDHGLSFPDTIDICTYEVVWTEWPQIHKPFSEREMEFIDTLNPKEDTLRLAKYIRFRDICLRNFRIASMVLIKCAKAGLTLSDIAGILYKEEPDLVAPIEDLIKRTEAITETMKNSISGDFLNMLAHKDKKPKIIKHFPQNVILEEKKEKEIFDKNKSKSTIKSFRKPEILSDITEEAEPLEGFGTRSNLKITKTSSLTDKKDSRKESMEGVDGSMEVGSEDSFDHEDDLSSPAKLSLKQPAMVRKASMPDLTAIEEEKENPEKTEDEMKEEKKRVKSHKGTKKKKPAVPAYLDDLFFYYFDGFLNQKIEAIVTNKFKSAGRWRFRSTNN